MNKNMYKSEIEENKRYNILFNERVPLNSIFFKVINIIIENFQERNLIFYEKRGIPFEYFCLTLNEQINLFEQEGIVNWCGYAQDYLVYLKEQNKLERDYIIFVKVKK